MRILIIILTLLFTHVAVADTIAAPAVNVQAVINHARLPLYGYKIEGTANHVRMVPLFSLPAFVFGETYFVRNDGSPNCNGLVNAPYPGSGVNQPCAFANADLQQVIDATRYGDIIVLQAGATYTSPIAFGSLHTPFVLRDKGSPPTNTDADYITIRSSAVASLPTGQVSAANVSAMAKILALDNGVAGGGAAAFIAAPHAKYYKFEGLEITNFFPVGGTSQQFVGQFVSMGDFGIRKIWLDRCYIHPQEDGTTSYTRSARAGIVISTPPGNGAVISDIKLTNNRISGFGGVYPWNPEPMGGIALGTNTLHGLTLHNNFLSATYQPWFPGGTDPINANLGTVLASPAPTLTGVTLSNVSNLAVGDYVAFLQSNSHPQQRAIGRVTSISGNSLTFTSLTRYLGGPPEPPLVGGNGIWNGDKSRDYRVTNNTFDINAAEAQEIFNKTGSNPKGFIEVKMGDNMFFEGNVFQGYPSVIAINTANQNSDTPWVTVNNFTFRNNWMRNFGVAFNIGFGNPTPAPGGHQMVESGNILIENNLFTQQNVPGDNYIGLINFGKDVTVQHNTFVSNPAYNGVMFFKVNNVTRLNWKDNVFYHSQGFNNSAFKFAYPDGTELKNAVINNSKTGLTDTDIQGRFADSYVASSAFPIVWVGSNPNLIDDWKLVPSSPYRSGGGRSASDGKDVGVDIEALKAALGGVLSNPQPTPNPTPASSPSPTPSSSPLPSPSPSAQPTPTPPAAGTRVVDGYLKVNGEYFEQVAVVTISQGGTVQQIFSTTPGGYFHFEGVMKGSIVSASGSGFTFGPMTIDNSEYFILNGIALPSPSPLPSVTPTPVPLPSVTPGPTPVATPTPSPVPTPTSTPTPEPSPSPSPTPTPIPQPTPDVCVFTVPESISIRRRGSALVSVSVSTGTSTDLSITATPLSGQSSVITKSRTITGTSAVMGFQVTVKVNSSSIRFDSICGSKTMQVVVVQ